MGILTVFAEDSNKAIGITGRDTYYTREEPWIGFYWNCKECPMHGNALTSRSGAAFALKDHAKAAHS